jgi:2-polyprenyl-3-methyl-5-hydroxy-6-metoxy-1,4-benzoquinol methylase
MRTARFLDTTVREQRAQRLAAEREGIADAHDMPEFYRRYVQHCRWLALQPWLTVLGGTTALDVGCGVGRWTRLLASAGANVIGVDISPTVIVEAMRHARAEDTQDRCRFIVADIGEFETGSRHSLIFGVTVLQHVADDARLAKALANLARHLAAGGRILLLEAAPLQRVVRDGAAFGARDMKTYLAAFDAAGLRVAAVTGVDPAPFNAWFMPFYQRLPRPLALAGLALATALAYPIDTLFGRMLTRASRHKVFVLAHRYDRGA